MISFKDHVRRQINRCGWFLRKVSGLPGGVSLEHDWFTLADLAQPRVILDVGAHHGETAARFTQSFPEARIISLEPVTSNFAVLSERSRSWSKVECYQLALSDRTGSAPISLQPDSQTHSLEARADTGRQLEVIKVMTLNDFASNLHLESIDLLKIDAEGHEISILDGARSLLSQHQIGAILLEASLDPHDSVHTQLPAASAMLRPFGFELVAIYDQVLWRNPTKLAYFNALFVRTRHTAC